MQYLVLAHAHAHPQLTRNVGNIALLQHGGRARARAAPSLRASVADAYREYRRAAAQVRLTGAPHARVEPAGRPRAAQRSTRCGARSSARAIGDDAAPRTLRQD